MNHEISEHSISIIKQKDLYDIVLTDQKIQVCFLSR